MFRGADESHLHLRKNIIRFSVSMSAVFRITWGCNWDSVSVFLGSHREEDLCVYLSSYP